MTRYCWNKVCFDADKQNFASNVACDENGIVAKAGTRK